MSWCKLCQSCIYSYDCEDYQEAKISGTDIISCGSFAERKKMKKYKVTMWSPLFAVVEAKNKEDALDKASDRNEWEAPIGQGWEKYDVEEEKNV